MAKLEIYTKATCGFCIRAKTLLEMKKIDFEEHRVDGGGPKKDEMVERAGWANDRPADLHRRTAYRRLRRSDDARARR